MLHRAEEEIVVTESNSAEVGIELGFTTGCPAELSLFCSPDSSSDSSRELEANLSVITARELDVIEFRRSISRREHDIVRLV